MEEMETFTQVKFELNEREHLINKLNDDNEQIYSLCRTLLDCVKQSMRNRPNARGYEEKSAMKNTSKNLYERIDNEVAIHQKCQEQLMKFEDDLQCDTREPEHVDSIELT